MAVYGKMRGGGTPLLARWTTEFDCGYETNWWYVIKNSPFDINALKAKRRYEINKGIKNFDVRVIEPGKYAEDMYHVQVAAFSEYPVKYRPKVIKEDFIKWLKHLTTRTVFGAFFKETNELAGYAMLTEVKNDYIGFDILKTNPEFERYGVNAAIVEKILFHYADFLKRGGIICDGARSVNHETKFQDYLEKYFEFRKAYCKLHIRYNPKIKLLIKLMYSVRGLLLKLDGIGIVHQINSVLKMEEICRNEEK